MHRVEGQVRPVCAVVLGGYVNGWGAVRSLHEAGVQAIAVVDAQRMPAHHSKKVSQAIVSKPSSEGLLNCLHNLHKRYEQLVLFPTSDSYVTLLDSISDQIADYCYLPFRPGSVIAAMDKRVQYEAAARVGVHTPETVMIRTPSDLGTLSPTSDYVLKPAWSGTGLPRATRLPQRHHSNGYAPLLPLLADGHPFLASEIVPGGDRHVYAYTAFRSREGTITGHFVGRKLGQYPRDFGVMSSAEALVGHHSLAQQGRRLIEELDLIGICEPEFKWDRRDGEYKLMEVNVRSMMWHRAGALAGVNLHAHQMADALGQEPPTATGRSPARLVYLAHEVANLIYRNGYLPRFRDNVFGVKDREFAFWDPTDRGPLVASIGVQGRVVAQGCLRRLKGE